MYSYIGHLFLVVDIHKILNVKHVLEIDVVKPVSQFYRWMYQYNSVNTDTPNWLTRFKLSLYVLQSMLMFGIYMVCANTPE